MLLPCFGRLVRLRACSIDAIDSMCIVNARAALVGGGLYICSACRSLITLCRKRRCMDSILLYAVLWVLASPHYARVDGSYIPAKREAIFSTYLFPADATGGTAAPGYQYGLKYDNYDTEQSGKYTIHLGLRVPKWNDPHKMVH